MLYRPEYSACFNLFWLVFWRLMSISVNEAKLMTLGFIKCQRHRAVPLKMAGFLNT